MSSEECSQFQKCVCASVHVHGGERTEKRVQIIITRVPGTDACQNGAVHFSAGEALLAVATFPAEWQHEINRWREDRGQARPARPADRATTPPTPAKKNTGPVWLELKHHILSRDLLRKKNK